jgi:hypothetical protein
MLVHRQIYYTTIWYITYLPLLRHIHIFLHRHIPSNPTVHFDNVSTSAATPTHSNLPRPSYYDGNGVTSTMPPDPSYFLYDDPLAQNIIDPESQSLGHRS